MRSALTIVLSVLALHACASTPTDAPSVGSGESTTGSPAPALDPERITRLDFYGGRCVGTPSADGIEGVTGVELDVGKTFVAELYFSAGTGYEWTATGFDASVVRIVEERKRPTRGTTEVGAQQMHTMNFKAEKPGRTRVTFELRRPWEKDEKPAEVRHTTIYVK